MLNNTYSYDQVGNVEQLSNSATFNDTNQLGGIYTHSYDYDNLNRLVGAHGDFVGNNTNSNTNTANYELAMEYNTTHGILYKKQFHHKNNAVVEDNTYKHHYTYKEGTHQVEKIEGGDVNEHYYYDANGNLEHRTTSTGDMRHLLWDESDRLRVLMDRDQMHHFIYDASGNRTLKASTHYEQVFENGQLVQNQNATLENYTTYASAYLVLDANKQYSKHYYVGSERIATQLGSKSISIFEENLNLKIGTPSKETTTAQRQVADLEFLLKDQKMNKVRFAPYKQTTAKQADEIDSTKARTTAAMVENTRGIYFFHNDHLGTGTFLTDGSGNPYQFFVNLPFGETFFEQHSYTEDYNNPYKFNGKELDEETGLYYYGARYYDPRTSIWLSVDPLAEKFPSHSPYSFCFNNPLRFVDPDGRAPDDWKRNIYGQVVYDKTLTSTSLLGFGETYLGKTYEDVTFFGVCGLNTYNYYQENGNVISFGGSFQGESLTEFDNITSDGIRVFGFGGDPIAGSGNMKGDRGSGAIQADMPGDIEMFYDFGQMLGDFINWAIGSNDGNNPTTRIQSNTITIESKETVEYRETTGTGSRTGNMILPDFKIKDTVVPKSKASEVYKQLDKKFQDDWQKQVKKDN
jgi:RHS repeat-associated protein